MAVKVTNVLVIIPDPESSSKQQMVPRYEEPLIKAKFQESLVDPRNHPIKANELPPRKGGERDPYHGLREHTIPDDGKGVSQAIYNEIARLRVKYAYYPEEHSREGMPLFDSLYPGTSFADLMTTCYPDKFPKAENAKLNDMEVLAGADTVELDNLDSNYTQDTLAAPKNDMETMTTGVLDDLTQIKHVGDNLAQDLWNAGFESVDDVAQTDPQELAQKVRGVTGDVAKEMVDHACDISLGETADITPEG